MQPMDRSMGGIGSACNIAGTGGHLGVLWHLLQEETLRVRVFAQAVLRLEDVATFVPARARKSIRAI